MGQHVVTQRRKDWTTRMEFPGCGTRGWSVGCGARGQAGRREGYRARWAAARGVGRWAAVVRVPRRSRASARTRGSRESAEQVRQGVDSLCYLWQ